MLKSIILDYKIGTSAKKRRASDRETRSYKKAQRIGIAFTNNSKRKLEVITQLARDLKTDGKEVEVLSFCPTQQEIALTADEAKEVRKKDLNLYGKWKTEEINGFIDTAFDYLLHLDLERNKYIDYIFAQSKANCRIGAYLDDDQHHYELIVAPEGEKRNLKEYISELKKYLKIIGSNEH